MCQQRESTVLKIENICVNKGYEAYKSIDRRHRETVPLRWDRYKFKCIVVMEENLIIKKYNYINMFIHCDISMIKQCRSVG